MRCHYEVLGVDRDADDGTLKAAYRKGALQWHPDKNQYRLEEADVRFKELQNAYEVLSDKHERAWYDSHRDAILRSGETHQAGGDGGVTPGQRPSDELDPFQYFSTSCYSGYNDGAKGFYTVYSTVFHKLAEEERQAPAAQSDQQGAESASSLPAFGNSSLSGPEVAAFYSSWTNYTTMKDFAWADKYNPAAAPNRKVRRLMEDENKKERKGVKRSHNDAVRELVAFVRKRDKRLAAHQAEEAKRRMEREEEDKLRREQERQERLQRALEVQEADWIQQGNQETEQLEEEEESIPDDFYCPLCDKSFKSQKALANHERSKQHVRAVEALRTELEEEEQALDSVSEAGTSELAQDDEADGQANAQTDAVDGQKASGNADSDQDHASPRVSTYTAQTQPSRKKSKKQKKKQRQQQAQMAAAGLDSDSEPEDGPSQQEGVDVNGAADDTSQAYGASEDDMLERMMQAASMNQAEASSHNQVKEAIPQQQSDDEEVTGPEAMPPHAEPLAKGSAASPHAGLSHEQYKKLKRHKRKNQPAKAQASDVQFSTSCATCGLDCKSRNKLFAHLKLTGHAALK